MEFDPKQEVPHITKYFNQAIADGCQMVSVTYFRRQVKGTNDWALDVRTVNLDGRSGDDRKAIKTLKKEEPKAGAKFI